MIRITVICMALLCFLSANENKLKITYVSPNVWSHQYFAQLSNFAYAVANDLGIEYETKFPDKNLDRFEYYEFLKTFYEAKDKPDIMMVFVYRQEGRKIFKLAEKYGIKTVVVNSYVDIGKVGCTSKPREVYDTYLGAVVANEVDAGFKLADGLIKKAKEKRGDKKLAILAIGGSRTSGESLQRLFGLEQRVFKDQNIKLYQSVYANWSGDKAYEITKQALSRYEDVDIIWCASDLMAIWAKKALKHMGREGIVVGGIDWSEDGLKALEKEYIDVSVGGHYLNAGIALILLYDYFHGFDFDKSKGSVVELEMSSLTSQSVGEFLKSTLANNPEKIDFKKFSKAYNKKIRSYDCSVKQLLSQ